MTDRERMAREAGMTAAVYDPFMWAASPEQLARLEALIRADERERCAKVVEMQVDRWSESNPLLPPPYPRSYLNAAAAAIRAGRE